MWNLSSIKEKIVVNCSSVLLREKISLSENKIEKDSNQYEAYSLQDLYDLTSIKNGNNIDLAASLIYKYKKVKVVINKKDESIKNMLVELAKSFEFIEISLDIIESGNFKLRKNDVVIKLNLTSGAENKEFESEESGVQIINVLTDKNSSDSCNSRDKINLYCLKLKNIDPLLSIEVLLKCIYLGALAKM